MEPEAPLAPVEPRRPEAGRFIAAGIVVVLLLVVSLAYHDGMFWTDSLENASQPGPYRFRGVLAHYDPVAEELLLREGDMQRAMHWNVTQPSVGRLYVVDAVVHPGGEMEALALTPVFVFRM